MPVVFFSTRNAQGGTVIPPNTYALVSGQVFTGNISAPNLSGTNTGDQDLTPYALLAGAPFTGLITGNPNPTGNNQQTALLLTNPNPATAIQTQISAGIEFNAQGWATTPLNSQLCTAFINLLPSPGAANPAGFLTVNMKNGAGAVLTVASFGSTGTFNCLGLLVGSTGGSATFIGAVFLSQGKATLTGTSGNLQWVQPFVGTAWKKVIIYCNALVGAVSFVFSTPFLQVPQIIATNGPAAAVVTALSATGATITGATTTGFIFLEGF